MKIFCRNILLSWHFISLPNRSVNGRLTELHSCASKWAVIWLFQPLPVYKIICFSRRIALIRSPVKPLKLFKHRLESPAQLRKLESISGTRCLAKGRVASRRNLPHISVNGWACTKHAGNQINQV